MTETELESYVTVAERVKIFVNEYQPRGMFMKTSHYWQPVDNDMMIIFTTEIFARNSKGKEFLLVNATACENVSRNKNSTVDPVRFCETSSRGRALSALGIEIIKGLSSLEDISTDRDYSGKNKKKETVPKQDLVPLLKRLKVNFLETDETLEFKIKDVSEKTLDILKKKGFSIGAVTATYIKKG